MNTIYRPKGRAREYSGWSLNIYNGCDHGCPYCFNRCGPMAALFNGPVRPRPGLQKALQAFLSKNVITDQVLLCFACDPYCQAETDLQETRKTLQTFRDWSNAPVAILTKGGSRCLRDLDIFKAMAGRIKVGMTLTFWECGDSASWEPGAALPYERIVALEILHREGVRTWASLEPVIDPLQSLKLIEATAPYVDEFRVGRWNHDPRADEIDWRMFGMEAVRALRYMGKPFYIKQDLRAALPEGFLTPEETDCNHLNLRTVS